MAQNNQNRMDKFLWSVRIFKTRALASEACKKAKVSIDGLPVKPSRFVKMGDVIWVKKPPVVYTYLVKDFPKSRISAKLAYNYIEDRTSNEELKKLEMQDNFFIKRDKGTGRPTKKDRRDFDKLRSQ